ncbi:MAG: hypothetical protein JGK17_19540 [Microcoleus sp. PH2017_10_PVI_O_A]|uniref:hypothetical protein n=1 Tax=unclassified Microcoleus TaxID=2642155 RepID=UPI001D1E50CB|nr:MULTISPECIES: hypothetical protein [unclassified Microcoleus]TAE75865.1 MAG: hypothetical protein EAZ83_28910 [Oscillatoriales cyanobacterium]MCC3407743.1 hypothetical protein [Microcoleus sp. PH2017_10_PVI_O_A]MCC3463634.1 hypothetical protein [Microcoleus sp. PH2017_11_PCY_U_A]MCC3481977.1 hypothetical protein [Microcoleus sp. PH2017_12_PCY_D_A]MCC3531881.1 hypothetical protein [Microcoleus sp. PH2017_21_RUC_O_A]
MELFGEQKRCLDALVASIEQLGGRVDIPKQEQIAELIIQTMRGPWRYFHTSEHIFEVGGSVDPIEVLAALFHDLVYVQVDQGVSFNISSALCPFVQEVRSQLVIRDETELPDDTMYHLVACVFGFVPGKTLSPFAGQNEFLSAVIAGKSLEPFLSASTIAQIAACIEATIPFRPLSPSGLSAIELLHQRLVTVNRDLDFGWTDTEIAEIVKRSVRLANRDVENFASPNSSNFLDNTWNLMPETNHELSNVNSYTVGGYRKSLQKMEGFLNFLKPELVFQQFMQEPDDETYANMIAQTRKNIAVAKLYLGIKLITIAILEALSYRLGRDIPLSTMMGELRAPGFKTSALEDYLPNRQIAYPLESQLEKEVLDLLAIGRNQESPYDIKNSPVATFIIKSIGFAETENFLKKAQEFFAGHISSEEFLSYCAPDVIETISSGVMKLFDSRKTALGKVKLAHQTVS